MSSASYDIQYRLEKQRKKVAAKPGVTGKISSVNQEVLDSIEQMQTLEPTNQADLNVTMIQAGQPNMSDIKYELLKNEAVLKRLVANSEVRVTEIYNRQVFEELLIPNLNYGYKLRLDGHEPPCRISFAYPGKLSSTQVNIYVSHDSKEPTASNCMESYLNPTKISIKGTVNPKT